MKIGVWLDANFNPNAGGAFSYYDRLISYLDNHEDIEKNYQIVFIGLHNPLNRTNKKYILLSIFPESILRVFKMSGFLYSLIYRFELKYFKKKIINNLQKKNVKIIYYLKQSTCHFPNFPFISTNWDIGHLSTYTFPEINSAKEIKRRSHFYEKILPRAIMVFCESESGKSELLRYTRLGPHKLKTVPLFSGNVSSINVHKLEFKKILTKFNLIENQFFFYPAQFWPHKNHYGLVKAFSLFLKTNSQFKLVLCGSDKGNLNYIKKLVQDLNIQNSVIFSGFVTHETLNVFYKSASSLIMASHFGPTNIPPIEAMEIGCPVICSDLKGHREILGDSALYFNSFTYMSIYKSMIEIVNNRNTYKNRIIKRNTTNIFTIDYSLNQISNYLSEAVDIRKNWL